eukprot:TRINITY_DN6087_c1_g3_i1.p1 TRINITY_DN6087_c1_g3~~TRINITY_DN6087_c1_g3_i1.p1  ORF type:complete len:614 (-),score=121.94 TRINITY_DN6087_c1_g3_i1:251-1984(-)
MCVLEWFSPLEISELRLATLNRQFASICQENTLFHKICLHKWSEIESSDERPYTHETVTDWKAYYRFRKFHSRVVSSLESSYDKHYEFCMQDVDDLVELSYDTTIRSRQLAIDRILSYMCDESFNPADDVPTLPDADYLVSQWVRYILLVGSQNETFLMSATSFFQDLPWLTEDLFSEAVVPHLHRMSIFLHDEIIRYKKNLPKEVLQFGADYQPGRENILLNYPKHCPNNAVISLLNSISSICEIFSMHIRRHADAFLPKCIDALLELLQLIHPNQYLNSRSVEYLRNSESVLAEGTLNCIIRAIGGRVLYPIIFPVIKKYLENSDWRIVSAGLIALRSVGEGCKHLTFNLKDVIEMVLPFLNSRYMYVQEAAVTTVTLMSFFCGSALSLYSDPIITQLSNLVVQSHPTALPNVCAAISNVILYNVGKVDLQVEAKTMTSLIEIIESRDIPEIPSSVLATISAIIMNTSADDKIFEKYRQQLLPILRRLKTESRDPLFISRCLRCHTLLMRPCGNEEINVSEISEVIENTIAILESLISFNDPSDGPSDDPSSDDAPNQFETLLLALQKGLCLIRE